MIDSLVSHSLWLRALLGLPEKETIYRDLPEEQGQTGQPLLRMVFPVPLPGWQWHLSRLYPSGGTSVRLVHGVGLWLPFDLLLECGTQKHP